jgi:hypothetical protein
VQVYEQLKELGENLRGGMGLVKIPTGNIQTSNLANLAAKRAKGESIQITERHTVNRPRNYVRQIERVV